MDFDFIISKIPYHITYIIHFKIACYGVMRPITEEEKIIHNYSRLMLNKTIEGIIQEVNGENNGIEWLLPDTYNSKAPEKNIYDNIRTIYSKINYVINNSNYVNEGWQFTYFVTRPILNNFVAS
jgi:hypothetical protein